MEQEQRKDLHTGHCRHRKGRNGNKGKISILGIADTGKNGTGTKEIDANYVLIWSGVSKQQRAAHGVGFIVHHDKAKNYDHRTPCNYNGNHVLELCAEHDLIVTNTFFQHRATQIYTWYKWSDIDVSSQIDFTLARSRMRSNIRDSRAIPNAGLDTEHRPVITTLVTQKKRKFIKKKKQPEISTFTSFKTKRCRLRSGAPSVKNWTVLTLHH
ncbi:hypothetical protein ACOMHN_043534 [Nucella lapillus]